MTDTKFKNENLSFESMKVPKLLKLENNMNEENTQLMEIFESPEAQLSGESGVNRNKLRNVEFTDCKVPELRTSDGTKEHLNLLALSDPAESTTTPETQAFTVPEIPDAPEVHEVAQNINVECSSFSVIPELEQNSINKESLNVIAIPVQRNTEIKEESLSYIEISESLEKEMNVPGLWCTNVQKLMNNVRNEEDSSYTTVQKSEANQNHEEFLNPPVDPQTGQSEVFKTHHHTSSGDWMEELAETESFELVTPLSFSQDGRKLKAQETSRDGDALEIKVDHQGDLSS